MTLFKEVLQNSSGIKYDQGVFYDTEIATQNPFHDCYLSLRRTEGRVYTDEIVSQLPDFKSTDNLIEREWKIRAKSAKRLATYLLKKKPRSVLEIGCGNGWLGNFLNRKLKTDYCGVDINQTELLQAAKLFSTSDCTFLFANITTPSFPSLQADIIVLASSAQYFQNFIELINHLQNHLTSDGEIHLIDTPFYDLVEIEGARLRSKKHFSDSGFPFMSDFYHHHTWQSIRSFNYKVRYNPHSNVSKLKNLFSVDSPFPWIMICK
jgi:ubiquinone/menaquinone biosynthesis C-methylase UbiE